MDDIPITMVKWWIALWSQENTSNARHDDDDDNDISWGIENITETLAKQPMYFCNISVNES